MARYIALCLMSFMALISTLGAQVPSAPVAVTGEGTAAPAAKGVLKVYTVPAGTRILLSLKHEISTRAAHPGDSVYLVSDFPVVEEGAVVLPAGMYVKGTIDSVKRPGKVKGRAQLQMHLTSMIFPNGVEIAIPGSLDNVPGSTGADVKNAEGTVEQAGTKGRDAERITNDTGVGAGLGGLAGLAGIGAGAGAAVGVVTTLFTRGNDIVFPTGTTLEMELTRSLLVQQDQLTGMPTYTGNATPTPRAATLQSPAVVIKPNN